MPDGKACEFESHIAHLRLSRHDPIEPVAAVKVRERRIERERARCRVDRHERPPLRPVVGLDVSTRDELSKRLCPMAGRCDDDPVTRRPAIALLDVEDATRVAVGRQQRPRRLTHAVHAQCAARDQPTARGARTRRRRQLRLTAVVAQVEHDLVGGALGRADLERAGGSNQH
eukprot:2311548-Prymnesium_polylepis.1